MPNSELTVGKVLIGVDKNNKIVSGTSIHTCAETLGDDLQYLASQTDLSIYVVDGPITIGATYQHAHEKEALKTLVERILNLSYKTCGYECRRCLPMTEPTCKWLMNLKQEMGR